MPLYGKRSAAPTRDTAEPALPGRWCRPLEGGDRRHEVRLGGGGHIQRGGTSRTQGVLVVDAMPHSIGQIE